MVRNSVTPIGQEDVHRVVMPADNDVVITVDFDSHVGRIVVVSIVMVRSMTDVGDNR